MNTTTSTVSTPPSLFSQQQHPGSIPSTSQTHAMDTSCSTIFNNNNNNDFSMENDWINFERKTLLGLAGNERKLIYKIGDFGQSHSISNADDFESGE